MAKLHVLHVRWADAPLANHGSQLGFTREARCVRVEADASSCVGFFEDPGAALLAAIELVQRGIRVDQFAADRGMLHYKEYIP